MNIDVKQLGELFIRNRDTVKSVFSWDSAYIYPVCAAMFTVKGMEADAAALTLCKQLIKDKVSVFSSFRGTVKMVLAAELAISGQPEERLEKILTAYDILKKHFMASEYLALAAMSLSGLADEDRYEYTAQRAREIYDLMKKDHPFLTSSEDCTFAALLALSDQHKSDIMTEIERCYMPMKKFYSMNASQSLAHVLALGKAKASSKCSKTIFIYEGLRAKGLKYGREYELATLGVLVLLPDTDEEIVDAMVELDSFLAKQKGYGFWNGLGKRQRLMHAAMLLASAGQNGEAATMGTAVSAFSAQQAAIAAAQQAAMCATIAAISASNAASNS